ncbi:arsenate reductase ArsC [Kordiimonas sp. SCSIO 12610]|uniref:arsenate reductase ArsC n=1 Tax=Kordiimonas sp. SCSIO 12610 TaxID=2829597 RepID=UPI00210AD18C|nr:arsenate reductase ArsC [Kordiimonas sp. SCSIO 12610]UTW55012.1 arsenate reductase ArsC [Kordiimonas sp. SCSIO 12610]
MSNAITNDNNPIINVLVLCTGNSARSVMGEATLNKFGAGKIKAFSAGSKPSGMINTHVKRLLDQKGYDTALYRSKSWDEFAGDDVPKMDIVVTVCDNAVGETCPYWPGSPIRAHCGFADPATQTGSDDEIMAKTETIYEAVEAFSKALVEIPFGTLSQEELQQRITTIADQSQMHDR